MKAKLLYSLDQTPLSINRRSRISRRTSGSAERNSRCSRIVPAPHVLFEKHAAREHASRLVLDGSYKKSKYLAVF